MPRFSPFDTRADSGLPAHVALKSYVCWDGTMRRPRRQITTGERSRAALRGDLIGKMKGVRYDDCFLGRCWRFRGYRPIYSALRPSLDLGNAVTGHGG